MYFKVSDTEINNAQNTTNLKRCYIGHNINYNIRKPKMAKTQQQIETNN